MFESREAVVSGTPAEGAGEADRGEAVLSFDAPRESGLLGEGLGEVARTEEALAMRLRSAEPFDGAALNETCQLTVLDVTIDSRRSAKSKAAFGNERSVAWCAFEFGPEL